MVPLCKLLFLINHFVLLYWYFVLFVCYCFFCDVTLSFFLMGNYNNSYICNYITKYCIAGNFDGEILTLLTVSS